MAEVRLSSVRKVYPGGYEAVKDFTLDIADGEFTVLVGASGCGKSTTLRMIAGLETVTDGAISIGGRVVNEVHPKDRDIAMVFQNYALYPHMTVYKNMAFALSLRRTPKAEIDRRVMEAARMLGLEPLLDRKPKALSGGQRQRVAVGRAIVREPKCFLFDEPLSNLDAKLRVTTRGELKGLHQRLKTTTVYVTHDQEEAMTLGDRVVVMAEGVIQQADSPFEVYRHPVNRFVAGFIGMPPMNFLEGTVERVGDGFRFVEAGERGQRLALPESHAGALRAVEGKPVVLGLRPTALNEARSDDERAAAVREGRAFTMSVAVVEPLGDQMDVHGRSASHEGLTARVPAHRSLAVGSEVSFVVDPDELHVFEPGDFGRNLFVPERAGADGMLAGAEAAGV